MTEKQEFIIRLNNMTDAELAKLIKFLKTKKMKNFIIYH